MTGFQIFKAEAGLRFVFNRVLPSFPGAGTETFTRLCEAMEPFGLTVDGISVPQPFPSRLNESILEFNLLSGKAVLKVGFGSLELIFKPLTSSDAEIAALLFEAASRAVLGDWEGTLKSPILRITYTSHLELASPETVEAFLLAHLSEAPENSGLQRDAVQYVGFSNSESDGPQVKRITFAKSVLKDSALFFECFLEYAPAFAPANLISRAREEITTILTLFGLARTEPPPEATQ